MTEFALTLPIVLLLIFGIIEFARIFQAWVTLQNSARVAVRAGITGDWDTDSVIDRMSSYSGGDTKGEVLAHWVPCTPGVDAIFLNHWGFDCDPENDDHLGLRDDMARLPWIVDNAVAGAAGLAIGADSDGHVPEHIVVLVDDTNTEIDEYDTSLNEDTPQWFHVWVCSSRPKLIDVAGGGSRYFPSVDRRDRKCHVQESGGSYGPAFNDTQYDAGGPGDVLEVVVHFNHPLITPIAPLIPPFENYVPLMARRVGVNEAFRSTRAVNLPPALLQPTKKPSETPTPSDTPPPSNTPLPSVTPPPPPSETPLPSTTPLPTPDCANIRVLTTRVLANFFEMAV